MDRTTLRKLASAPALIGIGIMSLGAVVIIGWLVRQPALVQFPRGTVSLVLNTGLSFFFAGLAVLGSQSGTLRSRQLQIAIGSLIVILNLLVLIENLTGVSMGLDATSMHEWMTDGNPLPGRQAPNTNLGFLCVGFLLILLVGAKGRIAARLVQALILILVATAGIGLIGYGLGLEFLYEWSRLTRMAPGTAVGLFLLAIALWIIWRSNIWHQRRPDRGEDNRITVVAGAIMAIVALCAGMGGFAILERQIERTASDSLQSTLRAQAKLFSSEIGTETHGLDILASRAEIADALQALVKAPSDRERRDRLSFAARDLLLLGYTGVVYSDPAGRELVRVGRFADTAGMEIRLRHEYETALFWNEGQLFLNARASVWLDGRPVGRIAIERPLPDMASALFDVEGMGDTAELIVCTRWNYNLLRCLPTRLELAPFVSPARNSRGDLYPIVHAIDGESGVARTVDRSEQSALVAYGPIGNLGLGMALKISTTELFRPVRDRLPYLFLWVGLLVAGGSLLVRAQVHPLAAQLLRSERDAKRSETRLHTVTDNMPALISFMDSEQRFQYVNKAHEEWFGQKLADIRGKTLKEVVGEEAYAQRTPQVEAVLRGERYSAERHRVINGRDVCLEIVYIPEFDELSQVIGFFVLGHDITDRKLNEARLESMALKDPLTGLANRRLFAERVEQAVAHARRNKSAMGILFVDLDGFKQVNDTLGHDVGDILLKQVAERLVATVREEDTVARMGGDEFAITLAALRGVDDARVVAEKIIATLSRTFAIEQQAVNISASVGVSVFPDHGKDADSLLKNADLSMYEAKRAGKNTFRIFDVTEG